MGLYTLKITGEDLSTGILEKAKTDAVDFEKDLENWLENSPNVLLDEDEGSVIWIGRQVSATVGESGFYPDLIGIDAAGDLVMVELKKGKTPREVVAQILEYAVWGSSLDYDDLDKIARSYYQKQDCDFNRNIYDLYKEAFLPDVDEEPKVEFNKNQKLFIVAEEISPVIQEVSLHLREKYSVDVSCMEYEVLKSKQGEYFISTEKIVGFTEVGKKHKTGKQSIARWSENVKVKDVITEAVMKITGGDKSTIFTSADVYNELIQQYPDILPIPLGSITKVQSDVRLLWIVSIIPLGNIILVASKIYTIESIKAGSGFMILKKMVNGITRVKELMGIVINHNS